VYCRGDLVGIQQCDIHARSNMPGVAAAVDGVVVGGDGGGGAEPQNGGVAAADGDAENERQKLIRCAHLLY